MPSLHTVPPEVRKMILEESLIVEGPVNPNPAAYDHPNVFFETNKKPPVALLLVNKTIHREAEEILYNKNLWRLSGATEAQITSSHNQSKSSTAIWDTFPFLFNNVITNFNPRDFSPNAKKLETHLLLQPFAPCDDRCVSNGLSRGQVEACWKPRLDFLAALNPAHLFFDFSTINCSESSCRSSVLMHLADMLRGWQFFRGQDGPNVMSFETGIPQKEVASKAKFTFIGLRSKREEDFFREAFHLEPEVKGKGNIHEGGNYFAQVWNASEMEWTGEEKY